VTNVARVPRKRPVKESGAGERGLGRAGTEMGVDLKVSALSVCGAGAGHC
jgi:hypothetical protein